MAHPGKCWVKDRINHFRQHSGQLFCRGDRKITDLPRLCHTLALYVNSRYAFPGQPTPTPTTHWERMSSCNSIYLYNRSARGCQTGYPPLLPECVTHILHRPNVEIVSDLVNKISHLGRPAHTLLYDNGIVEKRKFGGKRPGESIEYNRQTNEYV